MVHNWTAFQQGFLMVINMINYLILCYTSFVQSQSQLSEFTWNSALLAGLLVGLQWQVVRDWRNHEGSLGQPSWGLKRKHITNPLWTDPYEAPKFLDPHTSHGLRQLPGKRWSFVSDEAKSLIRGLMKFEASSRSTVTCLIDLIQSFHAFFWMFFFGLLTPNHPNIVWKHVIEWYNFCPQKIAEISYFLFLVELKDP